MADFEIKKHDKKNSENLSQRASEQKEASDKKAGKPLTDTPLRRLTRIADSESSAKAHSLFLEKTAGSNPTLAREALIALQRQYGNRYVQRVMDPSRKVDGDTSVAPEVQQSIQQARGGGQALDSKVRGQMESFFSTDFSNVRVHTDAKADTLNRALNSRAFTTGQNIFFKCGEYNPGSSNGRELLAHELTHVVQQAGGIHGKMSVGQPGDKHEQEADEVARTVAQKETAVREDQLHLKTSNTIHIVNVDHHVQRQSGGNEAVVEEPSQSDIADEYERDAHDYFDINMFLELRNAAAVEGAAIGRRASEHMADRVRQTCEPFERDQEIDTQILNNVFAISGGAANLTRGLPGGSSTGFRSVNIASRIVNIGINVLATNMPALAGYTTVGELKDAATRDLGRSAERAGETTSSTYLDYQSEVMERLRQNWGNEIGRATNLIRSAETSVEAQNMSRIARGLWNVRRIVYQNRLRNENGSGSSHAGRMIRQIDRILNPRMRTLREHLQEAKESRELGQGLGAIGVGIAGGAGIGAAIGAPAGGIGAVPGAIIGGVVGGVVGLGSAIAIWWD